MNAVVEEIKVGPLTENERGLLREHEDIIQRNFQGFMDVGRALTAIKEGQLYRETHKTFENYLRDRWEMGTTAGYQLINASEVVRNLSAIANKLPENEAQCRPLTALEPEDQRIVWDMVLTTIKQGRVTAAYVKKMVTDYLQGKSQEGENGLTIEPQVEPDELTAAMSAIKKRLREMEHNPEFVDLCQKYKKQLQDLKDEIERVYAAALAEYLNS